MSYYKMSNQSTYQAANLYYDLSAYSLSSIIIKHDTSALTTSQLDPLKFLPLTWHMHRSGG